MRNRSLFVHLTLMAAAACVAISSATPAEARIRFDLPEQSLEESLRAIGKTANLNILIDRSLVAGLRAPALKAEFDPAQAIAQLLQGTRLTYEFVNDNTVVLAPASAAPTKTEGASDSKAEREKDLETVIIRSEKLPDEYGGGQVARGSRLGLLGNLDVMETPFSTVNYTNQMMKNLGARNLMDVLVSDSSVRLAATTSRSSHTVYVRGFDVSAPNTSFDGLYGAAPPLEVAPETVERVELLKGPSALLNGMPPNGQIGGSINVTPKRARATPTLDLTASWYSDSEVGGHLDVGRRFGSEQQLGVRFNGVYRDGETSLENNERETIDALIGLDYVSGRLRLSGDFGYQERNYVGVDADNVAPLGVPDAPAAERGYLQPWGSNANDAKYGSVRVQYDVGQSAMVYAAAGASESEVLLQASFGQSLTAAGNFMERFWVNRRAWETNSAEAGFRVVAATGPVEHRLAFAALRLDQEFRRAQVQNIIPALASNLYDPVRIPRPNYPLPAFNTGDDTVLTSFGLADTLVFADEKVLVTLGLRSQQVQVQAFNSSVRYDERVVSPAGGLIVKVRPNVSLYGNYSEGLSRGPTAPGTAANAGEVFPPYQTKQFEAGVKVDHSGSFLTTLALFQIEQPSATTNTTTLVFSPDGERRHRGIELSTFGSPVNGLRLLGGITLMDPKLTRTQGGLNDGNRPASISKTQVSLGSEWDTPFLKGLTLTARGIYTSAFYVDNENLLRAPAWRTLDVGGRYAFMAGDNPAVVRLNLENVFNESYWNSSGLYRGAPRTVLMSASVSF